jgi:hypothetical protein
MAQARRRGEWARLERALDDRGIDRQDFERQAVRVIEDAWRGPTEHSPSSAFTANEARILAQGGLDLSPGQHHEPDIALRTATSLAVIEVRGATVAEVASDLHVSPARVRQRALERTLYAIRVDDEWRFPRWQFGDDGRPIPGIGTVVSGLSRGLHPVAVWRFMSEPSPDLEILDEPVSPLEWLRSGGDPAPVAAVAREL